MLPIPNGPGLSAPWVWLSACLLLSLVQVAVAGYVLGAGNQSIQIAFLKHAIDPGLYANDEMVRRTAGDYPSFFFTLLAWVIRGGDLPSAYFGLHLLATFGVLAGVFWLARAMFADEPTAWVSLALLLAGHHKALAGDALYSQGFTHTWAVFPPAILAIALLYRDRPFPAFALAGLLFNFHALTAAYLGFMFGAWALGEIKTLGFKKVAAMAGLFLLLASPTLPMMVGRRQAFDAMWMHLTHVRSGDHSFPSTWWQAGNPDLPRFALLAALGALALSFPGRARRTTLLLSAGAGALCLLGYVLADRLPVPTVIRAQLFRSTRLLMVPMFVQIAHGIVEGFRAAFAGAAPFSSARASATPPPPGGSSARRLSKSITRVPLLGWAEAANAAFCLLCVADPKFLPCLPACVAGAVLVALWAGRLSRAQGAAASAALLVSLLAWRGLHFPLAGWGDDLLPAGRAYFAPAAWAVAAAVASAAIVWLRPRLAGRRWARWGGAAVAAAALLGYAGGASRLAARLSRPGEQTDPWWAAQTWARAHTRPDAVFLTPARPGGFRIGSERAVVGEWRDGTQLYFKARFSYYWWSFMSALQPGVTLSSDGTQLLAGGRAVGELDDAQLLALCARFHATHLVLPADRPRSLEPAYANDRWAVYLPKLAPVTSTAAATPADVVDAGVWAAQGKFMKDVVAPNIEKYRKSDASVRILDADGRPVYGLPFELNQVTHAFGFGCSLPFFQETPGDPYGDFKPAPVTPAELDRFREVFNYSMIPFSGKWNYLEPEEGLRDYSGVDKYVDWCVKNNVEIEYHYFAGNYLPAWLTRKPPGEQAKLFLASARDLVLRYGDRIKYWQVVNDKQLMREAPAVFREVRRLRPGLKLGIADCARFYARSRTVLRERELCRGIDDLRYLKAQGVKVDYFGMHAHTPKGLWADAREMYESMDAFAAEGVKLHITEMLLPVGHEIVGPVRNGTWTDELAADYYDRYFSVCYSHPAVEAINLWFLGPDTRPSGSGLLDDNYEPRPLFYRIKDLLQNRWTTRLSGKLAIDGRLDFRGFHGDYELSVTTASGKTATKRFTLAPGGPTVLRLQLDREKAMLAQR